MSRFRPSLTRPAAVQHAPIAVAASPPAAPRFAPVTAGAAHPAPIGWGLRPSKGGQNGLAVSLLGLYSLMFVVPVIELGNRLVGHYLPIFPLAGVVLTVALAFSGRIGLFWQTAVAKPWMALLAAMLAAALFGEYIRLSTTFILQYGARFHILPFYACAFLLSTRQVRYCLYWICAGAILLLGLCIAMGQYSDGRLVLIPESSLGNPNDLGFALMLGSVVLLLLLYSDSRLLQLLWVATLPLSIFFILRTGSRANFLTLLILIPVLFTLVTARVRIMMLMLAPVAVLALGLTIPASTLSRLTLILSDPQDELSTHPELSGAIGSQIARTELQKRAVELTMHHPLLGVGAEMFETSVESMVRAQTGRKSGWQGAHNTYLEMCAEDGIPALVFYLWSLGLCFRMNYRSFKASRREGAQKSVQGQCLCLLLFTTAYCIGILFNNSAYDPHADLLVALSAANYLAIRREMNAPAAGRNAPALSPA